MITSNLIEGVADTGNPGMTCNLINANHLYTTECGEPANTILLVTAYYNCGDYEQDYDSNEYWIVCDNHLRTFSHNEDGDYYSALEIWVEYLEVHKAMYKITDGYL